MRDVLRRPLSVIVFIYFVIELIWCPVFLYIAEKWHIRHRGNFVLDFYSTFTSNWSVDFQYFNVAVILSLISFLF